MRNILFIALAGAAALFSSCNSDGIQTEHGYRFINHTSKGGQKPQPGETVLVQSYVWIGDSLMTSSVKSFGGPREYELFTKDALPKRVPALYDAVLLMSEGDSATAYMVLDSTMKNGLPANLKKYDEVRFEIVLADVITLGHSVGDERGVKRVAVTGDLKSKGHATIPTLAPARNDPSGSPAPIK